MVDDMFMLTAVTAVVALVGVCVVAEDVRASAVCGQRRDWATHTPLETKNVS